jgi:type VI secretion system secreted protein Hcp
MKTTQHLILIAALAGAGMAACPTVQAGEPISMKVDGIEGEMTQRGKEGQIELFAFNHEVASPYDVATGQAAGKRSHSPLRTVIRISKATPLLAQALATNQILKKVEIFFWRTAQTGTEENYFKITIENCRVASRRLWSPNKLDGSTGSYIPLEEVSFTYQKITWTYLEGNIEYQDLWGALP